MARKSGWQEFTENFNGVYDTFNKAAQGIETSRIMNDEKFTGEGKAGAGLEGSALEAARYRALSDIQSKYGDVKGALETRNSYESLRNSARENLIGDATQDDVIFQRGAGASGLLRSQTTAQRASAASSYASAANNRSIIGDRAATLPFRLEGLGLANDDAQLNYNLGLATFGSDVDLAAANAERGESEAVLAEVTAENAVASQESDQDATGTTNALVNAQNALGIDIAETALKTSSTQDRIIAQVMAAGYETGEEADAATIAAIQASDIPTNEKAQLISTIQKMGLETLVNEGAQFTQNGLNALGKGLEPGLRWFDGVDNEQNLSIEKDDDGTIRIMERRGGETSVFMSASGDTAEQQLIAQLATQISQPSNALSVAASVADLQSKRALTGQAEARTQLIDAQIFTEMMQTDVIGARNALVEAQTTRVLQEIESAENGLGASQEIAQRGLAQLQASDAFGFMGEGEGGRTLQLDAIGDYMRVMRMQGAPPAGVAGSLWMSLSDEEKSEFTK